MPFTRKTLVVCPNCSTQFPAEITQIIDIDRNPAAKARLVGGALNVFPCPNCGFTVPLGTILAYHDASNELLMVHVPMELNLDQQEQEQQIGQLIREITDDLPQEKRKGYLLNPRRAFTMQGMIDTILEADGITKEMLEDRRQKLELVEQFLRNAPEQLPALVAEHDDKLDEEFFTMLAATIDAASADGRQEVAEQVAALHDQLLQLSSYGQEVIKAIQEQNAAAQKITHDLQKLGQEITHEKLVDLAISYGDNDDYLRAFVGMVRPALDYTFFQVLTQQVDDAKKKKARVKARRVRERLLELVQEVDERSQELFKEAAGVIQEIANSPDLEQALRERIDQVNDVFIAVLEANIEEAQRNEDTRTLERLQAIHSTAMDLLMEHSPPEIRFINELMRIEDDLEMRLLLMERAPEYGQSLLDYIDLLHEQIESQGRSQGIGQRLATIRAEAEKVIEPSE